MNQSIPYILGIDIGGTQTKFGLVDATGKISAFRTIPTEATGDPQPFLESLSQIAQEMIDTASGKVAGIGYSVHGYIDQARSGPIVCPNTPALRGVNLRHWTENRFGLPVVINTDLTAHALAEYYFGTGQGVRRFLCLAIGTGLGAGVIIEGDALRFVGGCAGDNGHVIIQPGGPSCSMGCHGCAEALCGTAGVERLARERLGLDIPAHEVIAGAREGHPDMVAIMQQIGQWLGLTVASLCSIFLPERVALSGGTTEAGDVLLHACQQQFRELVGRYHEETIRVAADFYQGVEIVMGKLRGQTGVVGAAVELLHTS
jgi:glucokinase